MNLNFIDTRFGLDTDSAMLVTFVLMMNTAVAVVKLVINWANIPSM